MEVTVPEKMTPAARVITGKAIVPCAGPTGKTAKRRRSSGVGGVPTSDGGVTNSRLEPRRVWPLAIAGARIRTAIASRNLQLLPTMGKPQYVTSARRDTGETGQP